ncbi:DUF445 domain-containing protein [Pseudoduganella namucuonensis]|uniref:Uncharacterized membrane-anchored protein YjiN, DUF445 family n=1 Tax=Pseudoduganella namucuonensis TaxID=1035707 RepID=A0A1I7M7C8_9BURK|nr:DUF445 family protein [Pseudoduganella namucuonensis]SFV17797.1 Uncharacterized membrane-anchored protein YjiN, DUF445 family [Pseudoduganella namucuonensis]
MDKELELKKSKRTALLFLIGAAVVFLVTSFLPRGFAVDCVKAVSEAAMVGALADWFAVVALFRKVPIPLISAHTNIIPNNKDRIADNLALFVQEKFLDPASLVGLIRKHDPVAKLGLWLAEPANDRILGTYVVRFAAGVLDMAEDARIQRFLKDAFHAMLAKIDLAKSLATVLDALTRDGRHQEVLDDVIDQALLHLRAPENQELISSSIVQWLKREHAAMEKVLPTAWLGEKGADWVTEALNTLLMEVAEDRSHKLRRRVDQMIAQFIVNLREDPSFHERAEEIKRYIREGESVNTYLAEIWNGLRSWLRQDLSAENSELHGRVAAMSKWLGEELGRNPELRDSLSRHMEDAANAMAPDFAEFLTRHISDTVKKWDTEDMSRQIELNIGKDLQYIRINGTIVGGCIGLLLFLSSYIIGFVRMQ